MTMTKIILTEVVNKNIQVQMTKIIQLGDKLLYQVQWSIQSCYWKTCVDWSIMLRNSIVYPNQSVRGRFAIGIYWHLNSIVSPYQSVMEHICYWHIWFWQICYWHICYWHICFWHNCFFAHLLLEFLCGGLVNCAQKGLAPLFHCVFKSICDGAHFLLGTLLIDTFTSGKFVIGTFVFCVDLLSSL